MLDNKHDLLNDIESEEVRTHINTIRKKYASVRFAFIKGEMVERILRDLGASEAGLDDLKKISESLINDPTLAYRHSRNGRFKIDLTNKLLTRLEFQPFILTAEEDFVRHDSGLTRSFRGIQDDLQKNSAFVALMRFKALIINGMNTKNRPYLDYESPNWISTVFHLRTITNSEILGQPAAEGVHCDGVDHTMTTFLGSENMRPDSAFSKIHNMAQVTGTPWNNIEEELVVGSAQHLSFLDTLFIVDSELKHTVSPVFASDILRDSHRDMLVIFTRKPADMGHASFPYDSQASHPDMPLNKPLSPTRAI